MRKVWLVVDEEAEIIFRLGGWSSPREGGEVPDRKCIHKRKYPEATTPMQVGIHAPGFLKAEMNGRSWAVGVGAGQNHARNFTFNEWARRSPVKKN